MNDWQKAQRKFGKYPPLHQWEQKLRAVARSDNYALFRDHMRRLGLPDKPKLMLEGTIRVVQARWVFANLESITLAAAKAFGFFSNAAIGSFAC